MGLRYERRSCSGFKREGRGFIITWHKCQLGRMSGPLGARALAEASRPLSQLTCTLLIKASLRKIHTTSFQGAEPKCISGAESCFCKPFDT